MTVRLAGFPHPPSPSKSERKSFLKFGLKSRRDRRKAEHAPLFWKNAVTGALFHFKKSQCDSFRVESQTAKEQFDFDLPTAFQTLRSSQRDRG